MSSKSFAELGLAPVLDRTLAERGITKPFPVQEMVFTDCLQGHDVLVKSPTGSGKTLAFGLPMLQRIEAEDRRPGGLVLAPTRELALQIVDDLLPLAHARALKIAAVYGGAGIQPQIKRARAAHIVVATPGRLEDLIARRDLDLSRVRMLVLDEADRMLDMGFKPAVDRIVKLTPKSRQTLLFSATLDGMAGKIAREYTNNPRRHEHTPKGNGRSRTEHRFVNVKHEGKLDALVRELEHEQRGRTLVFVRTKRGADRLVKRLRTRGVEALAMHGDKSQSQREKALSRFQAGGRTTLVATDVAARGIDVDGITHVVNYDAPPDRDSYVHRVGRTGRAGAAGTGITFVLDHEAEDLRRIRDTIGSR
jgi:superfamily II DNA/RNA helicase